MLSTRKTGFQMRSDPTNMHRLELKLFIRGRFRIEGSYSLTSWLVLYVIESPRLKSPLMDTAGPFQDNKADGYRKFPDISIATPTVIYLRIAWPRFPGGSKYVLLQPLRKGVRI